MSNTIKYRPEIDGLRAIAVVFVILFHMFPNIFPGGFIGVDIFFVISGFLITSIILNDLHQNSFSLKKFWIRRLKRLLPVFLVVVFVVLVMSLNFSYAPSLPTIGKQGIATLLSISNINFWINSSNYWGEHTENSPFLHTWSLSIEEQFYLFFPVLLLLLNKYLKKYLLHIFILLSFFSFLVFVYGGVYSPTATFYLLPTRIWELGCGCLLGVFCTTHSSKIKSNTILSVIGLIMIFISFVQIDKDSALTLLMLLPVIGTLLFIYSSNNLLNPMTSLLSKPLIVFIGKISYSLYLWHWPVIYFVKEFEIKYQLQIHFIITVLTIIVLSLFSFYFIERPTRNKPNILKFIIPSYIFTILFSAYLYKSDFIEDVSNYNATIWKGQEYNVIPVPLPDHVLKRMKGISMSKNQQPNNNFYKEGGIIKLYGGTIPQIVVLGDSHAVMWGGVIDQICQEQKHSISFYTADGVSPFFQIPIDKNQSVPFFSPEEKFLFDQHRMTALKKWKPKLIAIASKWSDRNIKEVYDLLDFTKQIGTKVVLIEQPPVLYFGNKNTPQFLSYLNYTPTKGLQQFIPSLQGSKAHKYEEGRKLIHKISNMYAHCEVLPIKDLFNNNAKTLVLNGMDVLYIDDDHLSHRGTLIVKERLKTIIKKNLLIE